MLRLMFLFGLMLSLASPGMAQSTSRIQALIVAVCGAAPNSGYVVGTLQFVTMDPNGQLCPGTGGGGGGGAVTVADGADVTQGAIADAAATAGGTGTVSAKLRETTALLGSIATNTGAPIPPMSTTTSCTALCSNLVLENTASHNLYSFEISADSTLSAAPWYAIIYNAASLPANGAVTPAKCFGPFPINTTVFTQGFTSPIPFTTGITIGVSTTGCFTQTASVHAFISGDAQ